jgi:hypothetical protein
MYLQMYKNKKVKNHKKSALGLKALVHLCLSIGS